MFVSKKILYLIILVHTLSAYPYAYDPGTDEFVFSQQEVSDIALFARCYKDMTGSYLPPNNLNIKNVNDGVVSAIDACMEVYDQALLNSNNLKIDKVSNPVGFRVLIGHDLAPVLFAICGGFLPYLWARKSVKRIPELSLK